MSSPPPAAQAILDAHARLLERYRGVMDLVGPGPIQPHFTDAVGAMSGLDAAGRWADLGSGAGFPGVALAALFPDASVELVESRQKRATFLTKVVRGAPVPNATVLRQRTEDLPAGAYDGLVSRAYKPPVRVLTEDAARLLRPGGRVALLLGDHPEVPVPPGFTLLETLRYPVEDGHRVRALLRWGAA